MELIEIELLVFIECIEKGLSVQTTNAFIHKSQFRLEDASHLIYIYFSKFIFTKPILYNINPYILIITFPWNSGGTLNYIYTEVEPSGSTYSQFV